MSLGDAYHHAWQIQEGERIRREEDRYQAFAKEVPPAGEWNTCPTCRQPASLVLVCVSEITTHYVVALDGSYTLIEATRLEVAGVGKPVNPKPHHLECMVCFKTFPMEQFEHLDTQTRHERNYGDLIGRYVRPRR